MPRVSAIAQAARGRHHSDPGRRAVDGPMIANCPMVHLRPLAARYSDCCFGGFTVALDSALAEQPSPSTTFRSWSLSSTPLAFAWAVASAVHLPCFCPPVTVTELEAEEEADTEDELPVDSTLPAIWVRSGSGFSLGPRRGASARAWSVNNKGCASSVAKEGRGISAPRPSAVRPAIKSWILSVIAASIPAAPGIGCPKRIAISEGASIIRKPLHRFGRGLQPHSERRAAILKNAVGTFIASPR